MTKLFLLEQNSIPLCAYAMSSFYVNVEHMFSSLDKWG